MLEEMGDLGDNLGIRGKSWRYIRCLKVYVIIEEQNCVRQGVNNDYETKDFMLAATAPWWAPNTQSLK